MIKVEEIEADYQAKKRDLNGLIAWWADRIVLNPDLYFAPDATSRDIVGRIHVARREFIKVEAQYLSARGLYVFIGCVAGEHKKCNREVTRHGSRLVCGCECHKTGGVD